MLHSVLPHALKLATNPLLSCEANKVYKRKKVKLIRLHNLIFSEMTTMHFGNGMISTENGKRATMSLWFLNVICVFWDEGTGLEKQPSH